jgi:DNA-directed RNA polymerase specialized sigma24 family protein
MKVVEAGGEMSNLDVWFRSTAHNIVREKFRAQNRQKDLSQKLIQEYDAISSDENIISPTANEFQLNELWSRLEQLDPVDRKIVTLQAQGMSLENITTQLIQDGDCPNTPKIITNITQRASRARKQLREG